MVQGVYIDVKESFSGFVVRGLGFRVQGLGAGF
jgi:hypothetical protein